MIDLETVAVAWLKAGAGVLAVCPVGSIGTKLRRGWKAGDPALRVRLIGETPTEHSARFLGRTRLQVEAYGVTELAARAVAAAAADRLAALEGAAHLGAVVTGHRRENFRNAPDPDSDSERYLFDVVLYAHAARS